MRYVLASASPRRRELLGQILNNFEVIPATGEEKVNTSFFPEKVACALAESKCDEVFEKTASHRNRLRHDSGVSGRNFRQAQKQGGSR